MFADDPDEDELDRALARVDERPGRMPLYLTSFLFAVAVVEQVGQHLLA